MTPHRPTDDEASGETGGSVCCTETRQHGYQGTDRTQKLWDSQRLKKHLVYTKALQFTTLSENAHMQNVLKTKTRGNFGDSNAVTVT